MSILQEYESIRNSMGEEKYLAIDEYLNIHKELLLSDIYYKKSAWEDFEKWYNENKLN